MFPPFFVWYEKRLVQLIPDFLMLLQTQGNYTTFYMSYEKKLIVRCTMTAALKKLPEGMFVKVSRFTAVSVYYISEVYKDRIILNDETVLDIAKSYYRPLIKNLNVLSESTAKEGDVSDTMNAAILSAKSDGPIGEATETNSGSSVIES